MSRQARVTQGHVKKGSRKFPPKLPRESIFSWPWGINIPMTMNYKISLQQWELCYTSFTPFYSSPHSWAVSVLFVTCVYLFLCHLLQITKCPIDCQERESDESSPGPCCLPREACSLSPLSVGIIKCSPPKIVWDCAKAHHAQNTGREKNIRLSCMWDAGRRARIFMGWTRAQEVSKFEASSSEGVQYFTVK